MCRKRILLCPGNRSDVASLLRLATYCFSEAEHRLVSLKLKPAVPLKEHTTMTTSRSPMQSSMAPQPDRKRWLREYQATLKDLRREAQFSDLLLVEDTTYPLLYDGAEKSTLSLSLACPVFIAPQGEEQVEQIILVDDGEPTTYQHIKYLACLFSVLCSLTPTTLLITRDQEGYVSTQDEKLWINYLKLHFAQLAVHRVEEKSIHTLSTTVDFTKNALIIHPACPVPSRLHEVLAPLTQFKLLL